MVEYNSAETLDVIDTYSTDVMTGGSNKRMYLYNQLVHSLKRADSVDTVSYTHLTLPTTSRV